MTSKAIFIFVNMYSSQNNVWKSKKKTQTLIFLRLDHRVNVRKSKPVAI